MEVTTTPTNQPTNTNSSEALPPSPEDYLSGLMELKFNVDSSHQVRFHNPRTGQSTRWVEWRTFSAYSHYAWSNSLEVWISNLEDFLHCACVLGRTAIQKSTGSWALDENDVWVGNRHHGDIKLMHIEFEEE